MPGIINDRLHVMFSENYNKGDLSPTKAIVSLSQHSSSTKESLTEKKKNEFVTMQSFIQNFTDLFIGDINKKMRFCFNMYDFDGDGFITPDDVRIMLSYMPFKRNVPLQNVQTIIDSRAMENLSPLKKNAVISPKKMNTTSNITPLNRQKHNEGLYQDVDGKNIDYRDRISDQEDIK